MEKIQHYIGSLPEHRTAELDELIGTLLIERDKSRGLMLLHLDSTKYDKFKLKFTKVLEKGGKWEESLVDRDGRPLPHRIRDVLPSLLYNELAKVRAYDDLVHEDETSVEMLHALRIDVKILRYTLEFFEEVLGEQTKDLVKDLKALQDNLGDIHDAVVAIELLENYLKYGKWGSGEGKTAGENMMLSDPGVENYLKYRKNEVVELLEAFPEVWAKVMDPAFGVRFSNVIAELY
jgi:CHAD domain-containing protein